MGRKPIICKVKRMVDGVQVEKWNEPIENFLYAVSLGMSNLKSTEYAGFTEAVLYEWLARAEQDLEVGNESIFVEFLEDMKKTRAGCQAFHLQNVIKAGQNGNWQASAWILERVFSSNFSQHKQEQNDDDKIEVVNDVPKQQ